MDLRDLKQILDLMDERGVSEVEIRTLFRTVRISRGGAGWPLAFATPATPPANVSPAALPTGPSAEAPPAGEAVAEKFIVVKSPMVGTFYRAPAPDAEPFVVEGAVVTRGQVLCVIEAMKIMNEIESEHSGTVVKIHVENAAAVEYGQNLFSLRPA